MNKPDSITLYEPVKLKLAIKSSLKDVKETLALVILFWESLEEHPSEIAYSQQILREEDGENKPKIIISEDLKNAVCSYLSNILVETDLTEETLITNINSNCLFDTQLEPLQVALELFFRLAEINFVNLKNNNEERSGKYRYAKKLSYSSNIDIVHSLISINIDSFKRILLNWLGFKQISINEDHENSLKSLLTVFSENAIFELEKSNQKIKFNQNSIYKKLLETQESVDIGRKKESKGPLRILKSSLRDKINPYIWVAKTNEIEITSSVTTDQLKNYQERVDVSLHLSTPNKEYVKSEPVSLVTDTSKNFMECRDNSIQFKTPLDEVYQNLEKNRIRSGDNIILYGVPGCGKSWTIDHEYCNNNCHINRLVFHPDYTNSDFVGQILPKVDNKGLVTYKFTPGPFTAILRDSYLNPSQEYILIIEEINRGNAAAIFGETIQLLDRMVEDKVKDGINYHTGTSEYGITNEDMACIIYGEPTHKIRIPSNLSIIGTMNTSDQNIFTLDTAFQRRWNMRMIENSFDNVRPSLANAKILDTEVTWKTFCTTINQILIQNKNRMMSAEDKCLGVYFVHENDLLFDEKVKSKDIDLNIEYKKLSEKERSNKLSPEEKKRLDEIREAYKSIRKFPEKVIKYLWDDAFKFNPEALFNTESLESLEQVISAFVNSEGHERFNIFKPTVKESFYS